MPVNRNNLQVYLGNTRYIPFRLRRDGMRTYWNVSGVTAIQVEYSRVGDPAPLTPIVCSKLAPNADWLAGLVPALVSAADVTARIGTYDYILTVFDGALVQTAGAGRLEVLPRPVNNFETPSGSWSSTNLQSGVNNSGKTILAGQPVALTAQGIVPANSAPDGIYPAVGVAVAVSEHGSICLYIPTGEITLADWTKVYGHVALVPGSILYLAPDGGITDTLPSLPEFEVMQIIGRVGDRPQALTVQIGYTVVL